MSYVTLVSIHTSIKLDITDTIAIQFEEFETQDISNIMPAKKIIRVNKNTKDSY